MNKPFILVVEDDKPIRKLITTTLETQGYRYQAATTGELAIMEVSTRQPDLMILDLGLPDMDGVNIIRRVREWSNMPIIVVSARSEDRDKIEALDAGADDYLTKPFSVEELLARLRVSLRRLQYVQEKQYDHSIFINGVLKIDYAAGCVWLQDEEIHLTPSEYKLLCLLSKYVGKVLTHNYILHEIWGNHPYDIPALRVFMATLRKKIEPSGQQKLIQTHIGIGYRMLQINED
ncbi:two-component system KDP operon response regulator KdpE [Paenibacillus turicensis]|uniref:Two-component system KDP operon response regulator KdpE n=1 Tax=Paenibacillus turicensis TaxID=160487 RepID=A0ABS4FX45_9BACL|nr:response regulator transcription factor [Paenibacillus turicensis]MBP1907144.1 two-component system KDP operon response regulator KdpE [Paenibacillus turicensis]